MPPRMGQLALPSQTQACGEGEENEARRTPRECRLDFKACSDEP